MKSFCLALVLAVSALAAESTWNFRNDVIPVLTKAGCNQGACHGALAGKGGFKLTLRGYDPEVDYDVLTRQATGRRITLAEPASSLLLRKATMQIAHGGGRRFKVDSLEYKILSEWIAAGTPPPSSTDKEVVSLEVDPPQATLQPGTERQLLVRAKYSDGSVKDVTRWVKYNSNNEGVASVDENGRVKMTAHGEAAITLWYNSRVLYSVMTAPYPNTVSAETYAKYTRNNFIDKFVIAKLQSLNLAPSGEISDTVSYTHLTLPTTPYV